MMDTSALPTSTRKHRFVVIELLNLVIVTLTGHSLDCLKHQTIHYGQDAKRFSPLREELP